MSEERGRPEGAAPEEEWVEEPEADEWTEDQDQEWQEEAVPGTAGEAKPGPKPQPAYMAWVAGLFGLVVGLLAFRSCSP
jgi:hypothetical protein